jgi:hypothetical protein
MARHPLKKQKHPLKKKHPLDKPHPLSRQRDEQRKEARARTRRKSRERGAGCALWALAIVTIAAWRHRKMGAGRLAR